DETPKTQILHDGGARILRDTGHHLRRAPDLGGDRGGVHPGAAEAGLLHFLASLRLRDGPAGPANPMGRRDHHHPPRRTGGRHRAVGVPEADRGGGPRPGPGGRVGHHSGTGAGEAPHGERHPRRRGDRRWRGHRGQPGGRRRGASSLRGRRPAQGRGLRCQDPAHRGHRPDRRVRPPLRRRRRRAFRGPPRSGPGGLAATGPGAGAGRRVSDAVAVRSAGLPALVPPALPVGADVDLEEATATFAEWQARYESLREALPEATFREVSEAMAALSANLTGHQRLYLDSLADGDEATASGVVSRIASDLEEIRDLLVGSLTATKEQVETGVAEAEEALERALSLLG